MQILTIASHSALDLPIEIMNETTRKIFKNSSVDDDGVSGELSNFPSNELLVLCLFVLFFSCHVNNVAN